MPKFMFGFLADLLSDEGNRRKTALNLRLSDVSHTRVLEQGRKKMPSTQSDSQILVQSIMQRNPLKATSSDTVQTALDTMLSNHISALPVVDNSDCLIGIVSLNDLMPIAEERASEKIVAVMTEAPLTVELDESLHESARMMMQHQVHHLPVVGNDKRLVGVVSSIDFVRLVADGLLRVTS